MSAAVRVPRPGARRRRQGVWAMLAACLGLTLLGLGRAPGAVAGDETGFQIPEPEVRRGAPPLLLGSFLEAVVPADAGGWGYGRFTMRNLDTRARTVEVFLGSDRAGRARTVRTLEPGGAATICLPLLPTEDGLAIRVGVPGLGGWETSTWHGSFGRRAWRVLAVDDRAGAKGAVESAWAAAEAELSGKSRAPGGRTAEAVRLGVSHLPDRWPLLSGADAVLLEGSRAGIDAEAQRVLVTAVKGGGSLVVLSRSRLPAGPLRDLVAAGADASEVAADAARARRGTLGFGRWWSTEETYQVSDVTRFELPSGVVTLVSEVIEAGDRRPRAAAPTPAGYGVPVAPARFADALEVPGVGRVPVRTFFFTILGFALIAGPLSYVLLRRRRRLALFLVLLPSFGIACSAAILLYGLLSEGTGIRGSVRSLTLLDQRAHEAVTRSGRTLYAAFAPEGLRLDPQTLLLSDDFERSAYAYGYRRGSGTQAFLRLDATDGLAADGSALPSRIPITYDVTTVAPARERLRFRRGPDGRFEARYSPGLEPVAGARTILLRDLDGGWHRGGRDGALERLEEKDVPAAVRALLGVVADLPPAEADAGYDDYGGGYGRIYYSSSPPTPPPPTPPARDAWMRAFLPGTLPPGSYLALVTLPPAFDDLGLDVAWKRSAHLVHGLLSAEDFGE